MEKHGLLRVSRFTGKKVGHYKHGGFTVHTDVHPKDVNHYSLTFRSCQHRQLVVSRPILNWTERNCQTMIQEVEMFCTNLHEEDEVISDALGAQLVRIKHKSKDETPALEKVLLRANVELSNSKGAWLPMRSSGPIWKSFTAHELLNSDRPSDAS